jgi:hypothetical protein
VFTVCVVVAFERLLWTVPSCASASTTLLLASCTFGSAATAGLALLASNRSLSAPCTFDDARLSGSISRDRAPLFASFSESRSASTFLVSRTTSGCALSSASSSRRAPPPACAMPSASRSVAGAARRAPAASWPVPPASWSIPSTSWVAPSAPAASPSRSRPVPVPAARSPVSSRWSGPVNASARVVSLRSCSVRLSSTAGPITEATPGRALTRRWKSSIARSRSVVVIGPRVRKSTSNAAAKPPPRAS